MVWAFMGFCLLVATQMEPVGQIWPSVQSVPQKSKPRSSVMHTLVTGPHDAPPAHVLQNGAAPVVLPVLPLDVPVLVLPLVPPVVVPPVVVPPVVGGSPLVAYTTARHW